MRSEHHRAAAFVDRGILPFRIREEAGRIPPLRRRQGILAASMMRPRNPSGACVDRGEPRRRPACGGRWPARMRCRKTSGQNQRRRPVRSPARRVALSENRRVSACTPKQMRRTRRRPHGTASRGTYFQPGAVTEVVIELLKNDYSFLWLHRVGRKKQSPHVNNRGGGGHLARSSPPLALPSAIVCMPNNCLASAPSSHLQSLFE